MNWKLCKQMDKINANLKHIIHIWTQSVCQQVVTEVTMNKIKTNEAKVVCVRAAEVLEWRRGTVRKLTWLNRPGDQTRQMMLKWDSLFFFTPHPPLLPLPPVNPISGVNVTFLDAFHSLFTVPAWRRSVKPIYIWKWPFSFLSPFSSPLFRLLPLLPTTRLYSSL